jgi:hypothetical protein
MLKMINAHKTDFGASKQGYAMTNGYSFKIVGFCVGNGGHNPLNDNPISVDRSVTTLPNLIYTSHRISIELIDLKTIKMECTLVEGECEGANLSNLGILASTSDDDSEFLYAIANFALMDKVGDTSFILSLQN